MPKLRPGRTTRKPRRAYTRISMKKAGEAYIKGVPAPKIQTFEMGDPNKKFDAELFLVTKGPAQIRHNSLEAARVAANNLLNKKLENNFYLKVLMYPHQVIRENPMAFGHKADRYGRGMSLSFGKPKGFALLVKGGKRIMQLRLDKNNVNLGKEALRRASHKLPVQTKIEVTA